MQVNLKRVSHNTMLPCCWSSVTHIHTVQRCSSNAFDFIYKEIPFYRVDRERSQRQARWEMRHDIQQCCIFFFTFIFAYTKASGSKWYIAFTRVTPFPYLTEAVDKREESREQSFQFHQRQSGQPSLLNI